MTSVLQTERDLFGQLWRYGVTGLSNTALGYGLIMVSVYALGASILIANCIGYGAGWCLSYMLNRRWTFQHSGAIGRSAVLFLILVACAFAANLAMTIGLTSAGLAYPIAQIIGTATYSVAVFAGMKWMVFTDG
ncbi:MAG: GtrA family protein [Pseudomonadota bacterium]